MEIAFSSKRLHGAFEDSRRAVRLWGEAVARKYIARVITLQSARNFSDVRRLASLRAHALRGARRGQRALDLTARYRLIITPSTDGERVLIEEVSSHYGD